jgi:hypothetical protein
VLPHAKEHTYNITPVTCICRIKLPLFRYFSPSHSITKEAGLLSGKSSSSAVSTFWGVLQRFPTFRKINEGDTFARNVGSHLPLDTTSCPAIEGAVSISIELRRIYTSGYFCQCLADRDSSDGIATRYGLGVRGSNSDAGEIFRTRLDRSWDPPILLYNGYRVSFPAV